MACAWCFGCSIDGRGWDGLEPVGQSLPREEFVSLKNSEKPSWVLQRNKELRGFLSLLTLRFSDGSGPPRSKHIVFFTGGWETQGLHPLRSSG